MPSSRGAIAALATGLVLHAAVGYVILLSGLIMPPGAVAALLVVWAVALVAAIRYRRVPGLVLATPFATFAVWLVTAWVGDTFLGWTA